MTQSSEYRRTVTVNLENGLHLVPCSRIAQSAADFDCEVHVHKGDLVANARNVLELAALAAEFGTELELEGLGEKAAEAVEELVRLFDSNFTENNQS